MFLEVFLAFGCDRGSFLLASVGSLIEADLFQADGTSNGIIKKGFIKRLLSYLWRR